MYIVPDSEYTIDAAAKTITLAAAHSGLTAGQVSKIIDITSGEMLYETDVPDYNYDPISVADGVITYTRGHRVANTDKLRIELNSTYLGIDGGSA